MQRWRGLWVILAWLHALAAVSSADPHTEACTVAAPRPLNTEQIHRLCAYTAALELLDGPAQCAKRAIGSSTRASSIKTELADDVIELCHHAADTEPADCWVSVPASSLRSRDWQRALVTVCRTASDMTPAQCLLEFKQHVVFKATRDLPAAIAVVAQICSDFKGDVAAIKQCLNRVPRSLADESRLLLCRQADGDALEEVISCAKQLLQRNTKPAIVARVCATASKVSGSPEQCVLAAQQQLRWMEPETIAHLCQHSNATVEPVRCAAELRPWFIAEFSNAERGQVPYELARLCHGVMDHASVVGCTKRLPSKLFSMSQTVALCAGSAYLPETRADCVNQAKRELFGIAGAMHSDAIERSIQATLLLQLCERASLNDPIDCVLAAGTDASLTASDRIRLCRGAKGTTPYQCVKTIQPPVLLQLPNGRADAIELCHQATSVDPASCLNQLHLAPASVFRSGLALRLCQGATSPAPAECFASAPYKYSDENKVNLCTQATSTEPASCASQSVPRVSGDDLKARLCAKATSSAPTKCASNVPFGMAPQEVVSLCSEAVDVKPAECAQAVSPHLRIPWRDVTAVCRGARSAVPGQCLAHHVRQRRSVTRKLIMECRSMNATASSIELASFGYECPELLPRCPVIIHARVLDQFGGGMTTLSHGYVHFSVKPDEAEELQASVSSFVSGQTTVPIINGSAHFQDLHFTRAANYTMRLSSAELEEAIARVHVRWNETERREQQHCDRSFSLLQCDRRREANGTRSEENLSELSTQLLVLPNRYVLAALRCDETWSRQILGLKPVGVTQYSRVYTVPRMAYSIFTGHGIPTAAMNSWQRLGIPEGSNRSAIRHAYHQRSLEWHPDKWISTHDASSHSTLRDKVDEVYKLINQAYQELTST